MADDAVRSLICLIEGESSLFRVKPTGGMDIIDLKALIKEEGKNGVLGSVDAKDLVLWKVSDDSRQMASKLMSLLVLIAKRTDICQTSPHS
jgi:hypothetical protein